MIEYFLVGSMSMWTNLHVAVNCVYSQRDIQWGTTCPHLPAPYWDMGRIREPPIIPHWHVVNCSSYTQKHHKERLTREDSNKKPAVTLRTFVWILPSVCLEEGGHILVCKMEL